MNLKKKHLNLTEVVTMLLDPKSLVESQYFPSVLHENVEIQAEYGADNRESHEFDFRGWSIAFKPDQIIDDRVYELKVRRPYTKIADMRAWAYVQGLLQAYMLGKSRFVVIVVSYNPSERSKRVEVEREFSVVESEAVKYLNEAIDRFETLRNILTPFVDKNALDALFITQDQ